MIYLRFREKIPLRIAEWLGGLAMILIGLYLVIWPTAFDRAGLSGFAAIAPVGVWVGASLILGAARVGALVLNGHKPEVSAPIRCFVAGMGVGLFSSIAAGYAMASNEHGPPMAMIFAIDQRRCAVYARCRLHDAGILVRPVMPVARVSPNPAVPDGELCAIAVVFDLVQPAVTLRWRVHKGRLHGGNEAGDGEGRFRVCAGLPLGGGGWRQRSHFELWNMANQ